MITTETYLLVVGTIPLDRESEILKNEFIMRMTVGNLVIKIDPENGYDQVAYLEIVQSILKDDEGMVIKINDEDLFFDLIESYSVFDKNGDYIGLEAIEVITRDVEYLIDEHVTATEKTNNLIDDWINLFVGNDDDDEEFEFLDEDDDDGDDNDDYDYDDLVSEIERMKEDYECAIEDLENLLSKLDNLDI